MPMHRNRRATNSVRLHKQIKFNRTVYYFHGMHVYILKKHSMSLHMCCYMYIYTNQHTTCTHIKQKMVCNVNTSVQLPLLVWLHVTHCYVAWYVPVSMHTPLMHLQHSVLLDTFALSIYKRWLYFCLQKTDYKCRHSKPEGWAVL